MEASHNKHAREFQSDSVLNRIVSLFNHATDTRPVWDHANDRPKWVNLLDLLLADPGEYAGIITDLRTTNDHEKRARLKMELPAFTPSGLFASRKKGALIAHTGLIAIDIDAKDNAGRLANWHEVKSLLGELEFIAYAGLSASGTGLWAIIPIAHVDKHAEHFAAIADAFERGGLIIDRACKDVTRLRFWSYDPDGYINHRATTWKAFSESKPNAPTIARSGSQVRQGENTPPWRAFNEAYNIVDVLEGYGWQVLNEKGAEVDMTRPGKNHGKSAVAFRDTNRCYIWSSSAGLPTQVLLTPFDLFKFYEAAGDAKRAVGMLKGQ